MNKNKLCSNFIDLVRNLYLQKWLPQGHRNLTQRERRHQSSILMKLQFILVSNLQRSQTLFYLLRQKETFATFLSLLDLEPSFFFKDLLSSMRLLSTQRLSASMLTLQLIFQILRIIKWLTIDYFESIAHFSKVFSLKICLSQVDHQRIPLSQITLQAVMPFIKKTLYLYCHGTMTLRTNVCLSLYLYWKLYLKQMM